MAADSASLRVLAVDGLEPIRTVIDRVLTSSGYRVDVAASLAEARAMNPGGYDVILVDAFLGQERGSDLINELVAADPAAARRCLLVTGGRLGEAPLGVARLGKPFGPDDLISPTDGELARQLGEVERQLDAAARSLRRLAEAGSAFGLGVADLADTLRRHPAWLPFSSISLDVHPAGAAGAPGRASLTAELAELALFALGEHLPGGRADVTVRAGEATVEIELRLSPADGTPAGTPDTATAVPSLTELARALGGTAHYAPGGPGWQATITGARGYLTASPDS